MALERLGPYVIEGELGRGGMGVVYRARHADLDRVVALKVIGGGAGSSAADAPTLADEEAGRLSGRTAMLLARFRREAQAAGRLAGHPGIVGVHDVGIHPEHDTLYLAMELVEGRSLDDLIHEGDCSVEEAARLFARIAEAVHHAHTHGVLHRDLKPANVLLTPAGEPKVTDFGLAKTREASPELTRLTQAGELVGTPAYMAPEQVRGLGVDARTDVYALGVSLYETLAGRTPFDGESVYQVVAQVVRDDPPPLRAMAPHVPVALEAIVETCLQKQPEHRYASAADLAADLERFRRGEPVAARRRSGLARWWARRGRWVAAAAAVTAVAVGGGWWLRVRHAESSAEGRAAIDTTTRARTNAERAAALSSGWLTLSQQALEPMRALQNHFYGNPLGGEALAARLAAVQAAARAPGPAGRPSTTTQGWVALAELYAKRDGAWERLEALAQATPEDPLLQVLAAHGALANYAAALVMPHTEFSSGESIMGGYEESAAMAKWRLAAAAALDRAAAGPLWPLLTQAESVVAYAGAATHMAQQRFAEAAAALAPLADDPLFGDEAAGLAAFAHLFAEDVAAAVAGWERVGRRGWAGALHRGSLARVMLATQAGHRGEDPLPHMEAALRLARDAEAIRPGDSPVIAQVGMVQFGIALQRDVRNQDPMPDLEAALATFDRAAAAGPVGVGTLLNMAGARRAWAKARADRGFDPRAELRAALRDLSQGLELDPEWDSARRVLGDIWVDVAKFEMALGGDPFPAFDQARAAFQVVLDRDPRHFDTLLALATAWRAQVDAERVLRRPYRVSIERGLDAVRRALAERPAYREALSCGGLLWRLLGESEREEGRDPSEAFQQALTLFDRGVAQRPEHFGLRNNRALVHRSLGDVRRTLGGGDPLPHYRAAIADLDIALNQRPGQIVALYNRAVNHDLAGAVLLERGEDGGPDRTRALEDFDAVIAANPRMWHALFARAHLHLRLGNRAQALADYRATLDVNPNIDEARQRIAELERGR